MIDRRQFLRNAALLAAGVVAADQLEILEKLTWKRRFFSGIDFATGEPCTVPYFVKDKTKFYIKNINTWFVDFADISNTKIEIVDKNGSHFLGRFRDV